ncbi:MAG: CYTH domain-containing protein [Clostridiales bacterium]|nr:CYTH domain-containing protein [Clostridiales bacterium]
MPYEIERKFLVLDATILNGRKGTLYRQAYIAATSHAVVRVRTVGDSAYITVKSKNEGIKRLEYEYSIPKQHAVEMMDRLCEGLLVEKKRYSIFYHGHEWVVDSFIGANEGLIIAEIELENEEELFDIPEWVGDEVTYDDRYYNVNLIKNPYSKWNFE